jgi:hypothetical protein
LLQKQFPLSHRTATPFVYARQIVLVTVVTINANPCDGRHHKRECDTNFFVCLLVRRCRIDALALPLVCFVPHCGSRTVLPCPTNSLINARRHRRIAQPALRSCGSCE